MTAAERETLAAGDNCEETPQAVLAERDQIRQVLRSNDDREL